MRIGPGRGLDQQARRDFSLTFPKEVRSGGTESLTIHMVRPGRDGVTHYSYGEGFLAHLPKEVRDSAEVTRSRERPGRVSLFIW